MPTTPATSRLAAATYVAGSDDHVDRPDALGAVRERGDGLGAAHSEHLVDADQRGCREGRLGDQTVRTGRHAQGDLGHSGDLGGYGGHQHRGRVRRAAARYVEAGAVDRAGDLLELDSRALAARGRLDLELVVGADLGRGVGERGAEGRLGALQRGVQLGSRHPEVVDAAAVEALGEVTQRGVAARPHVADDDAHGRGDVVIGRRRLQECCKIRGAAEVETVEHGALMVTVSLFRRPSALPDTFGAMPSSDLAELSSLQAQLAELAARVVAVGDRYRETADSAVSNDLDLAERTLLAARRALERANDTLKELA